MDTDSKIDRAAQEARETQRILRLAGIDMQVEPIPCVAPGTPRPTSGQASPPIAVVASPPPPPPPAPAVVTAGRQLSAEHRQRHGYSSGLTDKTIEALRWWTCEDRTEALEISGRTRRSPGSSKLVPCMVLPHFDLDGKTAFSYLRPDVPPLLWDQKAKKRKPAKYLAPLFGPGDGDKPYFLPEPIIPRSYYLDVDRVLVVTEGIKKAATLSQLGVVAVSVQGTWMLHDAAYRRATNRWQLHPDFDQVPLRGRRVIVCFDGGDTTCNRGVILAEAYAAKLFAEVGATVSLVRIPCDPGGEKRGGDDFLATYPEQERPARWRELVDAALPADPLERASVAVRSGTVSELLDDLSFHATTDVMKRQDEVMKVIAAHPKQWALSRSRYERLMSLSPREVASELLRNSRVRSGLVGSSLRSPPPAPSPGALRATTPTPWSDLETRENTQIELRQVEQVAQPRSENVEQVAQPGSRLNNLLSPGVRAAAEALRGLLVGGPELVTEVRHEMAERGHSWMTTRRARTALGVVTVWRSRFACWRLPQPNERRTTP